LWNIMEAKPMKFFFVVGEKSGDVHAANLIGELLKQNPAAEIVAWGGSEMEAKGAKITKNYTELAFMGFWEVIRHLPKILGFLAEIKREITLFKPDQIVLVDYAGFNLRVAKWASLNGFFVNYYIAPKTWVWRESRVYKLKKYVKRLFVIFPFEQKYFSDFGIETYFCGNPVWDQIASFKELDKFEKADIRPLVALLPGSRKQEIENMLVLMNACADSFPEINFKVAAISEFSEEFYMQFGPNLTYVFDSTYDLISNADAAIVTSGTATLETAFFKVPQVVVYKTKAITYYIAKSFIKIPYISLVNIISQKKVVVELIQDEFNLENLKNEIKSIVFDTKIREKQFLAYNNLIEKMGTAGASSSIARILLTL
jgi:lipid-A-disaccharide synthase